MFNIIIAVDRGMGTHIERVIWLHGTDGLDDYSIVGVPQQVLAQTNH